MAVARSQVSGNTVTGNSGGILLTDEFGPTHGNLISSNVVKNNVFDCGITLPGHNGGAFVNGHLQPTVAGVFDNVIRQNIVDGNGTSASERASGCSGHSPAPRCTTTSSSRTSPRATGSAEWRSMPISLAAST